MPHIVKEIQHGKTRIRTHGIQAFQRNVGQQAQRLQPSTHQTQAVRAARKMLRNSGELTIKGTDNRIRAKDTVPEGNDPHPPEG